MIDWGAGSYETTAAELEAVSEAIVIEAGLAPGERVLDRVHDSHRPLADDPERAIFAADHRGQIGWDHSVLQC